MNCELKNIVCALRLKADAIQILEILIQSCFSRHSKLNPNNYTFFHFTFIINGHIMCTGINLLKLVTSQVTIT